MNKRTATSSVLVGLGLLIMLAALIDPLEGAFAALVGSGLAAGGAILDGRRYRAVLLTAFALLAFGCTMLVVLTMRGGFGGHSGHSWWWGLLAFPYLVGWLLGLIGAIAKLIESWRQSRQQQPCAG